MPLLDDSLVIDFPAIVKASTRDGKRVVEVEASNEVVDSEGDVVLQQALLGGAPAFLRSGVLDIDHISEIGDRLGVMNTAEWIVGVPLEVKDLGGGRTSVVGELTSPGLGQITKADELWNDLHKSPPVVWRASIFGWPIGKDGVIDVRNGGRCADAPSARRFVIKSLDWRSLAFTRRPVNDAIVGQARVVMMKAFLGDIAKAALSDTGATTSPSMLPRPRNKVEMLGHYTHHINSGQCSVAGDKAPLGKSVASFRNHFCDCCGLENGEADLMAHALMHILRHTPSSHRN